MAAYRTSTLAERLKRPAAAGALPTRPRVGQLKPVRPAAPKRPPSPARPAAPAMPVPHLGAQELMDLGGRVRQSERALADIDYEYDEARLAANRNASRALEDHRHNAGRVEDRMAALGRTRSSTRDTALYRNDADTSERIAEGQRGLYTRSADDERRRAAIRQDIEELLTGYAGVAAENARALPVADADLASAARKRAALARQRAAGRAAGNTKGVRTLRRP